MGPLKQTKHSRIGGPRPGAWGGWLAGWLADIWMFGCSKVGSLDVWRSLDVWMLGCLDVWSSEVGSLDDWSSKVGSSDVCLFIFFFFGCLDVRFNRRSPTRPTAMGRWMTESALVVLKVERRKEA